MERWSVIGGMIIFAGALWQEQRVQPLQGSHIVAEGCIIIIIIIIIIDGTGQPLCTRSEWLTTTYRPAF